MKTVLITGANKSIGFETAMLMAEKGYYVFVGSRDLEDGKMAAKKIKNVGDDRVEATRIDFTNPNSVAEARQEIECKSGWLDILINNTGISGVRPQLPSSVPVKEIRKVFDTNYLGIIHTIRTFFDPLKKSDCPVNVNVTSGLASLTLHSDPAWRY
jgi:NAD(P)-dependent dehydrogenase (short-subunit alcohol dehydrogenase family)